MKWKEFANGQCFISDLGQDQTVENAGKEPVLLGRYAAWAPTKGGGNYQIIDVSSSLDELMDKYGIPQDRVCALA